MRQEANYENNVDDGIHVYVMEEMCDTNV